MSSPPPTSSRPASWRSWGAGLALVVVTIAVYAGSFGHDYIWDDNLHVTENPHIIGPLGLKEIWTTAAANYFPLVLTNFWIQHALWGLEPAGYHVVTVVLHALAALLLWRVLAGLAMPGAWLGAALWALHPVQVESVAWISELKNTQSAVFFFLTVLCYLRSFDEPARRRWWVATFFCAVLAILSKPSTVMLPVVLGLCRWWRHGRLGWKDAAGLAPFFALALAASGWTIWEQKVHSGASGAEWSQGLPERIAIAGCILWFYLGKLLWPEPLIFIYPRWQVDPGQVWSYGAMAAALGVGGWLAWQGRGRLTAPLFAALYFGALLFPVLGFFNIYFFRYSYVGDHFQYLASAGPLALLAALLVRFAGRFGPPAGLVLVGVAAVLTWRQVPVYRNHESLWLDTTAKNPAAKMAWLNLADYYSKTERLAEAIACYRRALELNPDDPDAHNDLGGDLLRLGRRDEALVHLRRAAELRPDYPEVLNNYGNALQSAGRLDEAIAHYERAVAIAPKYAGAHSNLGTALAEKGRLAEAVAHFETARQLRPKDGSVLENLGQALQGLGRTDEALTVLGQAVALRPESAVAHLHLGGSLIAARRLPEAIDHFAMAAKLQPSAATIQGRLGTALVLAGRWQDALPPLERAVQLDPNAPDPQRSLGVALVNLDRLELAVGHFEASLRGDPNSAETHFFLGQTLQALGRPAAAREHLAQAERLRRR